MIRYYCTYFDRQYLIKGLALIHSLQRHSGDDFKVFVVCADELTRFLLTKLAQRLGRIIHSASIRFVAANGKCQIAADSQFEHFDSILRWRQFAILLMRRDCCRQKPDRVQLDLLAARFRQKKMAHVDRVERAAKDADSHEG